MCKSILNECQSLVLRGRVGLCKSLKRYGICCTGYGIFLLVNGILLIGTFENSVK